MRLRIRACRVPGFTAYRITPGTHLHRSKPTVLTKSGAASRDHGSILHAPSAFQPAVVCRLLQAACVLGQRGTAGLYQTRKHEPKQGGAHIHLISPARSKARTPSSRPTGRRPVSCSDARARGGSARPHASRERVLQLIVTMPPNRPACSLRRHDVTATGCQPFDRDVCCVRNLNRVAYVGFGTLTDLPVSNRTARHTDPVRQLALCHPRTLTRHAYTRCHVHFSASSANFSYGFNANPPLPPYLHSLPAWMNGSWNAMGFGASEGP